MPLFLLTMFTKNEKVDLSGTEKQNLAKMTKQLKDSYKGRKK